MFRHTRQISVADIQLYRLCDDASGGLICLMVVFGPWVFGTTQPWAIQTMNFAAGLLGVLLLAKLFIRKFKNYSAPRWDTRVPGEHRRSRRAPPRAATKALAWLTVVLLLFCLVSALNAAATWHPNNHFPINHPHFISWLPHSFDSARTWSYFWMYLGMAAAFWSIRDWLLGRTENEEMLLRHQSLAAMPALPARLRQLLWVLAVSGFALGFESIVQRAAGSSRLLFLVQPVVNTGGDAQFGPYAYRANAAQYFNLLWPLCLGMWWMLRREGGKKIYFFPVAAAVLAACPIISTSRGGALVSAGMMAVAAVLFVGSEIMAFKRFGGDTRRRWKNLLVTGIFLAAAVGLGWHFGWEKLSPRMEQIGEGYSFREQMYADAQQMTADYPVFGTGPGTFATVFQLYRIAETTYWPGQLHNDWLETLITFGWTGLLLALAALGCVTVTGFFAPRRFALMAALAMAGCLIHARFDFPLQVHSILFLFLLIAAMLVALGVMRWKH